MIQLEKEKLILLKDAPKHLPLRPGGKKLHISAVYRWITHGVRGVVLESVRLGGATYTSLEALQRFAEAQSRKPDMAVAAVVPPRSRHRHQRAVAMALAVELGTRACERGRGSRQSPPVRGTPVSCL